MRAAVETHPQVREPGRELATGLPCFAVYNVHLHFGPNFQEKNLLILNSIMYVRRYVCMYLFLETKPVIVFQGTTLHMDIVLAF